MGLGASDKNIFKQGYIEKRGDGMLSEWKKRYIVLYKNSQTIEYYTDKSKKQLKGKIDISRYNLAKKSFYDAVHINLNNLKHGFDIECKNRTWMFRCENDKIKQDWIDAILLCIKDINCERCPNIYHCHFEYQVKSDDWIVVWPLLKLGTAEEKSRSGNDDKKSDSNKSDGCDRNDKILYLFDNKTHRDQEKVDKAIKKFTIPAGFVDIYEYFPFSNENKEYYCILDKKYVFRCKNYKQRELFIDGICEKVYYQDDDRNKTHRIR